MTRSHREHSYSHEVKHYRWNIQHVIGPVTPPGEKSVKVAKHFFGPKVNAAFTRITMCQLNHRDPLGPEKEQQRDDPQPDRYAAIGGNARNNIEIKNGND